MSYSDEEEQDDQYADCVVALYDFDPNTIEWPFRRQQPLALQTGQVIQVIQDDGSEWALGQPVGEPHLKGYFPKNYTLPFAEYQAQMQDYPDHSGDDGVPMESGEDMGYPPAMDRGNAGRGRGMSDDMPLAGFDIVPLEEELDEEDPNQARFDEAAAGGNPYTTQDPGPSSSSTHNLSRTRGFVEDPPFVPRTVPRGAGPPAEDMAAALAEAARDQKEMKEDPTYVPKAKAAAMAPPAESRTSTPATQSMTRPDRDFVRRHLPMELQDRHLRKLSGLQGLCKKEVRIDYSDKPAYPVDDRVRATTCRTASGIEPPHLRMALARCAKSGAKWTQMFRPGFNDIVNETFKAGCNACILSKNYLSDARAREQFQRMHVNDVHGTMWFELQRRKEYLFYQRWDCVDVMMWHPDAWGFPDTALSVSALPGEPFDPMHGWCHQPEINAEKEMMDVEFAYNLRMRLYPADTFQALALGKVPGWMRQAGGFGFDSEDENDENEEDEEEIPVVKAEAAPKQAWLDQTILDTAGLGEETDTYRTVEEIDLKSNIEPPEVLAAKSYHYRIRGIPALRVFLRGRATPDSMQVSITPKIVKDMAAQLGIKGQPDHYWYCMFALRYPMSPEWEVYIKNDTRWYLHLPTNRVQSLHPMILAYREHMLDALANEFLWDFRGFQQLKCGNCGIPDAVVWCMQCTDYFCPACFFKTHKSARGKKHWPMPIPGSRYLQRKEVERIREHIPLLNVGFSNRRRFLATDNQSDKNGSRSGDTWLYFHADTFQQALVQAPQKHWFLKRLNPPRLAPDSQGYYYNFAGEVLCDEPTHIMTKQHEQRALSMLQRNMRGAITRRRIKKEVAAARVLQKFKVMWDAKQAYGEGGQNRVTMQNWYRKFRAKQDRKILEWRVTRCQAIFRGCAGRKFVREMLHGITLFQAHFRGLRGRRHMACLHTAASTIQRMYRGHLMGRKPMHDLITSARKIQAMFGGADFREGERLRIRSATYIQGHWRGVLGRKLVARMTKSAIHIQTNWRRFQAQLDTKIQLYDRLAALRAKYMDRLRLRIQAASATLIQRNWHRHVDQQRVIYMKLEKSEADKRIQTLLVAVYAAGSCMRHHVHPWWRHLPSELTDVLEQIKGSLQRTIALVPVVGKLANEEIGRKGLRIPAGESMTYVQPGKDPDLASHLLLSVTRHLCSHVPAEIFPATVKWACYAIGHQSAALAGEGIFPKEVIQIGKDPNLPPHPGDTLPSLWDETGKIRHHHDGLMTFSDETFPGLVLHGLNPSLRQIQLTAQVLVTMRQALDTPTLSTDDHLKFQGLDATSGAQLMEVLSCEMDHSLPSDLPQKYGTVASLSAQISEHISQMQPLVQEKKPENKPKAKAKKSSEVSAKGKAKSKAKGKAKAAAAPKEEKPPKLEKVESDGEESSKPASPLELEVGSNILHFNRRSMLRVMQQVGFFMRDQDSLMESVLNQGPSDGGSPKNMSMRQSRYVSVTDKLFEIADTAKHDHCSFIFAVVLFHMCLRALCLRVLYHRAAMAIQVRYRYIKQQGMKAHVVGPAIIIQRFWRGLRVRLRIMREDSAAAKIQHSYKVWRWNRRAQTLLQATLRMQRVWRGAIHRKWLRHCHTSATYIQKIVRGSSVRLVLDKEGRFIARQFQVEMNTRLKQKDRMSPTEYIARTSVLNGKLRSALARHRDIKIDMRRMPLMTMSADQGHKENKLKRLATRGSVQPMRLSEFEPMVFALAKMEPKLPPRYGATKSRILNMISETKKELDKDLPRETPRLIHAGARRGRNAVIARRLAKKPKFVQKQSSYDWDPDVDRIDFDRWASQQFEPKRFSLYGLL